MNISEGRRASRMYKAGPGSLAGQGRELEGEKCKETEREKKNSHVWPNGPGWKRIRERGVCVCECVSNCASV